MFIEKNLMTICEPVSPKKGNRHHPLVDFWKQRFALFDRLRFDDALEVESSIVEAIDVHREWATISLHSIQGSPPEWPEWVRQVRAQTV
jgi:hypothetical protein